MWLKNSSIQEADLTPQQTGLPISQAQSTAIGCPYTNYTASNACGLLKPYGTLDHNKKIREKGAFKR
jgi:hypothetical protein